MSYPSNTLYPGSSTYPGTTANGGTSGNITGVAAFSAQSSLTPSGRIIPLIPTTDPGRIQWNLVEDRQIETGIDRGVLYLKSGAVVPWNGLTSVDEEGGEGAAEYYVDGRPFLYLPKPKEYKATIKAYTYPDEFSSVMGEVEIADGMYLDSQMSDSFDLSYRTRIVDSIQGENAGYKIHLIYNATVVPSAKSYGTIGDSITPVDFSWDIQAVPVNVAGYRPTAHITISTKNMDSTRIEEIEDLIYGTIADPAQMPNPQTIFDLLSFGGAIIITDNGNGTWTAEGSYQNIYMIGDEIFQIDNVNATNHGDGTFTISSTP